MRHVDRLCRSAGAAVSSGRRSSAPPPTVVPHWFDEPPEPLGPEPVDRLADRLLAVLGVTLLLVTVAVVVGLVVLAGMAQGTWSLTAPGGGQ